MMFNITLSIRTTLSCHILLVGSILVSCVAAAENQGMQTAEQPSTVNYSRDIAPIFARNCIACHNAKKPEGGLNLESHKSLMMGGDSGDAVVERNIEDSYLVTRILDTVDPMPPKDNSVGANALNERELELLKHWIEQGAPDSPVQSQSIQWQRIADHLRPIYAVEASGDGNFIAVGRGSKVEVISQPPTESQMSIQALLDAELKLPDGSRLEATHLDMVQSLAISPDSQRIATGGYRSVKLWRRQLAGQPLLTGLAAASNSDRTAVSPDGKRVATATSTGGLELANVETGQAHRFLKAHTGTVTALLWLSDALLLSSDDLAGITLTRVDDYRTASGKADDRVVVRHLVLWNERPFGITDDGKGFELVLPRDVFHDESPSTVGHHFDIRWLDGLPAKISALAATEVPSPRLMFALEDNQVISIQPDSSELEKHFQTETKIQSLTISPDGSFVAVVPTLGAVELWNLGSNLQTATLNEDYIHSRALRVAVRDTARQAGMVDRLKSQIPELEKASKAEEEAREKVLVARDKAAEALTAKVKEIDDAQTAFGNTEQALNEAQAAVAEAMKRAEELTAELKAKEAAVLELVSKKTEAEGELAKRDQALATADVGMQRAADRIPELQAQIALEDQRLNQLKDKAQALKEPTAILSAANCVMSTDGSLTVIAGQDNRLRLYSTTAGLPIANLTGPAEEVILELATLRATSEGQLIGVTHDGSLLSWDLALPWYLERAVGGVDQDVFSDRITALHFSPDGRLLAVGSGPPSRLGDIKLIDVDSGKLSKDLGEAHTDTVLGLRFSPDGRYLASAAADRLSRLFDVQSGQMLRTFEGHTHHVLSIAWHDSGEQLATAGADNTVKIWNVATGEQQRTITDFKKEVTAAMFVDQTSQLATAAADSSVRLFNADDGKVLRSFVGGENALFSLAVSADGKKIFAGGQASKLWTWLLEDGKLLATD